MAEPVVRDPVLGDAEAVAALQVRSWQRAYRGMVPDSFLDELQDDSWLDRWREALARPPRDGVHRLVSTAGGHAVAVALCGPASEPTDDRTGQLYVLYTHPDVWDRGHGNALLAEVHRRLADDGHVRALLWVAAENQRSIAFYEHRGWALDGSTQREEVAGATFDEARMVRELI